MIVIGIHDGHNCGVTIVENGKVLASVLEERLTRKKNEFGFPAKSIIECLKITKNTKKKIDYVVFSSKYMHSKKQLGKISSNYDVGINEQLKDKILNSKKKLHDNFIKQKNERIKNIINLIKIPKDNIFFYDHHLCHVASAYYLSNINKENKILGISFDGSGDNSSGKVFVCKQGVLKNIASSSRDASLGKIYSRITYLLGMKPWEHEYKVMGLAPYANSNYSDEIVKNVFKKLIYVDKKKLTLKTKTKLSMNYCYKHLSSKLNRKRFDNISGAIQKFTEDILLEFVKSAIKKTKIKKLVFGGGVFMNVKANKLISKLKEIEDFFFMPSCGDDSLSFGAALHFYYQKTKSKNFKKSSINNLYLGNKYEIDEENKILNKYKLKSKNKFIIYKKNLNSIAAKLLKDGKVIGRCADRAEWGARALGNRSIIARPDNYLIVDKINEMVKKRDFWMPFAPSILENKSNLFFDKKNKDKPYFMTVAYDTKKNFHFNKICAASHIRDKTIRPQLVNKMNNGNYFNLINKFYKITKIPALLNTSFNLHGYPIVNTPEDAIKVFLKSGIDAVLLNNYLILKK